MKRKEKTALQGMTITELHKRAAEFAEKLNEFRIKRMTTQVKNTREGKSLRKAIAIIESMVADKELMETGAKGKAV